MAKRLGWIGTLAALCSGGLALCGCSGEDGAQGPAGPAGADGMGGDPSISAVVPNGAFLARTLDVTISGYGTEWTDSAVTVDFGTDVMVNSVVVASPTALVANITVDAAAVTGARDVSISGGAEGPLTYAGAFHIDPPYELVVQGAAAQGAIFIATAHGRDLATPFDMTTEGDGFFTPITYPNITVNAPAGVEADVNSVGLYSVDMLMMADVNASAGVQDLEIVSGPEGNQTLFPGPGVLTVEERTATDITIGTDATGTVSTAYESALFRVSIPSGSQKMLTLQAGAFNPDANALFAVLPESGLFADLMDYTGQLRALTPASGLTLYLVYWDNTGTSGYDFVIQSSAPDVIIAGENEPNDDTTNAEQASALGFVLDPAQLSSVTDEDWIAFTAAAGDVGKRVHVITFAGDPYCDTVVEVFEGDGTTSMGGESVNTNYHEDHESTAITAPGTHYVKISADQTGWYDPAYPNYGAFIELVN